MAVDLFSAIDQNDVQQVRALLSRNQDPNAPDAEGWRPIHVAIGQIGSGRSPDLIANVVALLIEYGADVNAWDVHHNETPILSASVQGGSTVARLLLEAGADPNVRNQVGDSPLRLGVWAQDVDLVALLLRFGADKTINEFGGDFAWTALGIAAHLFNVRMIRLLLEAGADPTVIDDLGRTARDLLPSRENHDPETWDEVMELLGCQRS